MPLHPLKDSDDMVEVFIEEDGDTYYINKQYSIANVEELSDLLDRITTGIMNYAKAAETSTESAMRVWKALQADRSKVMRKVIRDWSHKDESGAPVPVDPNNIKRMPSAHMAAVLGKLREVLNNNQGIDSDSELGKL